MSSLPEKLRLFAFTLLLFLTGYLSGRLHERERLESRQPRATPQISPLDGHPVMRNPQPALGSRHPSFNCARLRRAVPRPNEEVAGRYPIGELSSKRAQLQGEEVRVNAVVVGVYPEILGKNWYQLCDEPEGEVLMITSTQRIQIGQLIEASGRLLVDYRVGEIYRFPIFISEATLTGEGVESTPLPSEEGTISL